MPDILVIDDEPAILSALGIGLRARGYVVHTADTGAAGLSGATLHAPDVIVLDLALPDMAGVDVCRQIRAWTDTPIVVLSVMEAEEVKISLLDAGADDFITKPFAMGELLARLRVALRHADRAATSSGPLVELGPLEIDFAGRQVTVAGDVVALTAREFDLLAYLVRNLGKVITHRTLLQGVWGPTYDAEVNYLRVYVNRLRSKLGPAAGLIRTSPGVGYQVALPPV